jgi:hypothetical protein
VTRAKTATPAPAVKAASAAFEISRASDAGSPSESTSGSDDGPVLNETSNIKYDAKNAALRMCCCRRAS